ncbi:hypothetical protein HZA87_03230 [Candidatus Uhrbacteria bacterium]|nr:hypothetical protein [Candidatus Uhrbacteria bacterium]
MLEQVVEHVCRKNRLAFERLLELVAADDLVVLLAGVEVQADLVDQQLPPTLHPAPDLIRLAELPSIGEEGVSVEVQDRVGSDHDSPTILEEPEELRRHLGDVVDEGLDLDPTPGGALGELAHELPALSDKRHALSFSVAAYYTRATVLCASSKH